MHASFRPTLLALSSLAILAMAGCSHTAAPKVEAGKPLSYADYGQLEIAYAKSVPAGSEDKLSFSVRNPYSQTVEGVRVIFRVTSTRESDGLELARVQKEFDVTVERGNVSPIEIVVPPEVRQRGAGTFLHAYAIERGGQELPLPPEWRE